MKRIASMVCVLAIVMVAFCGCYTEEPAYMHPYGEGVDPDTVTTSPFQTRVTTTMTTLSTTKATKPTLTTVPHGSVNVEIPEGHILCPLCQGVLVICETCLGTTKVKVEVLDGASGVYVRKYAECPDCVKMPGYAMCEMCENVLYIEE